MHGPITRNPARSTNRLLILGGSQGARSLNQLVFESLPQMSHDLNGWQIVHQTGDADAATAREHYTHVKLPVEVCPFIDNLSHCYRETDVVISRAGATTLAELACCGLPSVLVPFPHAARDHQTTNAEWYAKQGAALLIRESVTDADPPEALSEAVLPLLHGEQLRRKMSERCREVARPHAAREVAQQLRALSRKAAA